MPSKKSLLTGTVWLVPLACLAVLVQAWHGLGWRSEAELNVNKNLREFGAGWSLRLPPALRDRPVVEAIAAELEWVQGALALRPEGARARGA